MAKKQKTKRNKYSSGKRVRAISERQDYRKGGRVGFDVGGTTAGFDDIEDYDRYYDQDRGRGRGNAGRGRGAGNNNPNYGETPEERAARLAAEEAARQAAAEEAARQAAEKAAQEAAEAQAAGKTVEQKQATRTRVEEGMQGIVPDAAQIPDAEKIDENIKQQTTTMAEPTKAQTFQAKDQPKEAVATSQAAQADETIGQDLKAAGYDAATVADKDVAVDAAQGTVTRGPIGDIQGTITAPVKFASVDEVKAEAAKAKTVDDILTGTYLVDEVEVLGEAAPDAVAAAINDTVGYEAAKQRAVKGTAAQGAAADMIAATGDLPPEISAAIVQDPATVEAQIDNEPVEVQAAVAALPTEALVSSQMDTLLGGMEDGEVPLWAKPAVDAWLKEV